MEGIVGCTLTVSLPKPESPPVTMMTFPVRSGMFVALQWTLGRNRLLKLVMRRSGT